MSSEKDTMSILEGSVGRASDVEQKGTMPTTPKTVDRTPRVLTVLIYVAAAVLAVAILTLAFHKDGAPRTARDDDIEDPLDEDADFFHNPDHEDQDLFTASTNFEITVLPWTTQRVLRHFSLTSVAQLRWSDPVVTEEELMAALQSGAHVVEVPIVHAPTQDIRNGPVVGWDTSSWKSWHLTLKRVTDIWVETRAPQALMLNFRDPRLPKQALSPLNVYQRFGKLKGPVFIGAELLPGPGRSPPVMATVPVPRHVSEAFRQAIPELRGQGFHPHPQLGADESFLDFLPGNFLSEIQAAFPGAFLVSSWSISIPCPKNYLPSSNLIGRRLLSKKGRRPPALELSRWTQLHMNEMAQLIEHSKWSGGVAIAVNICHIDLDAGLWNAAIGKHNSAIPPPGTPEWKAALPWQREQWAILMHGTMTDAAGALVRKEFSPHNLMLNVSDVHGQRIIL